MKKIFFATITMLCETLLFGATIEPGDSSKRHKTDYVQNWDSKETQTYTVSASASGCSFVDSKTKASEDAILKTHSSTSASAEKRIEHTDVPNTSAFGFSVSGVLAGSGSGNEVTWSVTLQQKFFWLEPMEKIVSEGTAVTIEAKGVPTESTWNINNAVWKNHNVSNSAPYKTSSITLNRDMWDKMKWTPSSVPNSWKCPPAGVYNISATTTEESEARSSNATIYVIKLQDVRVSPVGSSGSQNVVVKTGDKVNISVTALPSDTINGEKLPFRWSIRQMESSGEYGPWSAIAVGNDKSSFEYTTTTGGIFQVKVEVKKGDVDVFAQLKRQTDDEHSSLKKDDDDAFGVCDTATQVSIRSNATSHLGSTAWAYAVSKNHPNHGIMAATYGENSWKCNLFVCECNHFSSGNLVPLINGGGGIIPTSPPTANQWADGTVITGWTIQNTPQPGFVWAKHAPGATGHCGIVDYDGRVISAGTNNVNRKQTLDGATVRKYN